MSLTVLKVKNSKAVDRDIKLSDSGGLFLLIKANGSKYWRLAYRFKGKQKTLSFGVYPEVSLLEAREKSLEAKKHLSNGTDPASKVNKGSRIRLSALALSENGDAKHWHRAVFFAQVKIC